jgi:hypothetical protein
MLLLLSNRQKKSVKMLFNLIVLFSVFAFSGCRDSLLDTETLDKPPTTDLTNISNKVKDQFFKIPDDIRSESKEILLNIQAHDQENSFVTREWIAENGLPVWDKIFTPSEGYSDNTATSRNAGRVKDMSFIPLKDSITQEIKSFIAVYKIDGNSEGYRLYNKRALLNFFPSNAEAKNQVISTLAIHAFFEDSINGKKKLVLPAPYNEEITKVKIKTRRSGNNFNSSSCFLICIEWQTQFPLRPPGGNCSEVCTYNGPIVTSGSSGSGSCSLCGGGLGSNTNTSGGGSVNPNFTALDGLIYNGSLLADLSTALDPDGMPLSYFQQKFPDYVHLVLPLRELKQKLGDIDLATLEGFVRYPILISQCSDFLDKYNSSPDARKIVKLHVQLYATDQAYRTETNEIGKVPVPVILWILKAAGETVIDLGIDLAFGYLTGQPPGFWDEAINFGSNLIGTGEIGKIAKIAKYTAKINEIVDKVKLIRGGVVLADRLKNSGEHLIKVLEDASFLSEPQKAWQKVNGAIDAVVGTAYESRIAISLGNKVKAVGLRNQDLADNLGISFNDLSDLSIRRGDTSPSANNFEVDILEDLGNGVLSISEAKSKEAFNSNLYKSLDRSADLALERYNKTGKNTIVTLYIRDIDDLNKGKMINRYASKGVTLRVITQP